MKKMYGLVLVVVAMSIMAGCKKDDPTPSVVGFWSGTYDASSQWHMLFRSNGTVRVYDGADTATAGYAEGTYTVSDSVRTHYYYSPLNDYSTAAKMNDAATSMTGTYGSDLNTAGDGTFTLSR